MERYMTLFDKDNAIISQKTGGPEAKRIQEGEIQSWRTDFSANLQF
jgi:hypothetical protein